MASLLPHPPILRSLPSSFTAPIKPVKSSTFAINHPPKKPQIHLPQLSSLCEKGLLREAFALVTQFQSESDLPLAPEIYGELLQGCIYDRALPQGQQIHARILKFGSLFHRNEYMKTKLLIFYAKCGCLVVAEEMFRQQCRPNVFSWAAMIGLRCQLGLDEEALVGFVEMLEAACLPDNFVIPNALKACSSLQCIGFGRGIHGYALKMGFGSCVYVLSSLVDFYGKCTILGDAWKVFEEMPERNVITWNAMLVGNAHNGLNLEVLELFHHMRIEGIQPTRVSISCLLSSSANLEALAEGKQGHAVAILMGLELDNILGSSLINFYCKAGLIEDAECLFNRMADRDVVIWNLLVSGYVQDGQIGHALTTCSQMIQENFKFDSVTLTSIISAAAISNDLSLGKVAHSYCIRNNLDSDLAIASSIVDLYGTFGRVDNARRLFDLITDSRDLVMWNTMISAYAHNGLSSECLNLFYQMQLESVHPNVISWNSLILGFLRNSQVDEALAMFAEMQNNGVHPDIITWTSLIHGLAENGYGREAINLYFQMQTAGIRPNPTSIVGLLLACTNLSSLHNGRMIHGYITRHRLVLSPYIATSLIDMYSKCGSIDLAANVFRMVSHKTLTVYNVLISGYALHGKAKEALTLYDDMCERRITPDGFTFTGLLSACAHAGAFAEGIRILTVMVSVHDLTPQKEHYGCLAALFARHGRIKQVFSALSATSIALDAYTLTSLLTLCKENRDIEFSEDLSGHILDLEPDNVSNYVALANLYARSGRWKEASHVRMLMKQGGMKTNPGCSWIQTGGETHVFTAADQSHPQFADIARALLCLDKQMKNIGCSSSIDKLGQTHVNQGSLCH
ncbi:hypothetical protein ZIOFF_037363 [Zingiber officinale]|uniref:Chlororespiratory reduction 21 n=1 Tax=Zingiber officinale TaxID=94328 RepID=A0A8J5L9F6_ZINOF|nr:hypothetical protein ZIOFF_037363 [Zingiber officinale]